LLDLKKRENWKWTSMILQPGFGNGVLGDEAMEEVRKRKNPPALPKVRFERFDEGLAAQIMHSGPFADEPLTIDRLDAYVLESGYGLRGRHHEIYLTT
jgi:hypothetical protein